MEVVRMEMFEGKERLAPIIFEDHSANVDVEVLHKMSIHRFWVQEGLKMGKTVKFLVNKLHRKTYQD
jgi:hypothetical protein